MNNTAVIFDIERNSFVDGPGIRTTVFFKGCNLHCAWCHNPESQRFNRQMMYYRDKCTGCGKCREICPHPEECALCGKCELYCPADARKVCGKPYTSQEVLREVLKDKAFYQNSGGGVTFSGGECMLQLDFLTEILQLCREQGLHTAVDTAGHVPFASFEKVLPYADMFLYDVKGFDSETHKKYVGVDNTLILENLAGLLARDARVWVRIPTIPGVNACEEEMRKIRAFFEEKGWPEKVELLPYHAMGENKARALGVEPELFTAPEPELMDRLKAIFAR